MKYKHGSLNMTAPEQEHKDIVPFCFKHRRWPCAECGTSHYHGCECYFCRKEDERRIRAVGIGLMNSKQER